ncbi:MAG TPA: tRNA (adenosine(37)-N6)-threonylcarbamoyltransferase complex dimerization subunit type 1 TsaB [Candidatus Polarisedimenticolaceae bacterium]|nr:tRNA (adenosine(37)-N6)-threonylcarbamoyltransferase complex dimerization subunit type 1 TsaB [Candidatus Polarisedimenticolaceae bacterium]
MRIVAVDASSWWGGVALLERRDGRSAEAAELGFEVRSSHVGSLLAAIDHALALADWNRSSLDGFVATRGPGSFTGVRIGLGIVRGLGLAADRPCAGVATLDSLAAAFGPAEGERLALISAGRGEIFGARYHAVGVGAPLDGPWLMPQRRLADALADGAVTVVIPAKGSEPAVRGMELERFGIRVAAAPGAVATAAGRLALSAGLLDDPDDATMAPLYLRPPDAELESFSS